MVFTKGNTSYKQLELDSSISINVLCLLNDGAITIYFANNIHMVCELAPLFSYILTFSLDVVTLPTPTILQGGW
jgi:hypothetical protein